MSASFDQIYADANDAQRAAIDWYVNFDGIHPHEGASCVVCSTEFYSNSNGRYCGDVCRRRKYEESRS